MWMNFGENADKFLRNSGGKIDQKKFSREGLTVAVREVDLDVYEGESW